MDLESLIKFFHGILSIKTTKYAPYNAETHMPWTHRPKSTCVNNPNGMAKSVDRTEAPSPLTNPMTLGKLLNISETDLSSIRKVILLKMRLMIFEYLF